MSLAGLVSAHPATAASTITVETLTDGPTAPLDKCTLREAILNADSDRDAREGGCVAGSGADTILFSVSGSARLVAPLPTITDADGLVIDGGGVVTVSGDGSRQILDVAAEAEVELRGLTLEAGLAPMGGAVRNLGDLTLIECTLVDNQAVASGGAIWSSGPLTIEDSVLSNNTAGTTGGAIYSVVGRVRVTGSTISLNSAALGGGIYIESAATTIGQTRMTHNRASAQGGAFYNNRGATGISDSFLSDNRAGTLGGAGFSDGGLNVSRSEVARNTAAIHGGALYVLGSVTVSDSRLSANRAEGSGGAIHANRSTLIVRRSEVEANEATLDGGGIYGDAAAMNISRSTISANAATRDGGGITSAEGTLSISNTALVGNPGSGVHADGGSVSLSYTTVAANPGGGVVAGGATTTFARTILSENAGGNCVGPPTEDWGYNLEFVSGGSGSCAFSNNAIWGDPRLRPLAGDGSPGPGLSPTEGSPAVDVIAPGQVGCSTPAAEDIRGLTRPQGGACDVGAVEVQPVTIESLAASESDPGGVRFVVSLSTPAAEPVRIRYETVDESATSDEDFTMTVGTLSIPAGQSTGQIVVTLIPDDIEEDEETFLLSVTASAGGAIAPSPARGTIFDDD